MDSLPNVYQNFSFREPKVRKSTGEFVDMKGKWAEEVFLNSNPIVLELACGRGEYTIGLAGMFPETNFIGVDLKGNRVFTGARSAIEKELSNVAFLRTKIELIQHFFAPGEVSAIWITFADPFLNPTDANKRLTAPPFLEKYRSIMAKGGTIHLKTDSEVLYEYSLKVAQEQGLKILEQDDHIYKNGERSGPLSIKTYYEKMHLANQKTIKYLSFVL
ncbi:MAG: tRNA (guanosine(46)-N7)-methyltransferase TrmB [Chitinophagales bacterium]|nr:tRNA (guanosine(46)-N7)-methyltransferase TrmB [Chitinophagales bacterium]